MELILSYFKLHLVKRYKKILVRGNGQSLLKKLIIRSFAKTALSSYISQLIKRELTKYFSLTKLSKFAFFKSFKGLNTESLGLLHSKLNTSRKIPLSKKKQFRMKKPDILNLFFVNYGKLMRRCLRQLRNYDKSNSNIFFPHFI